MSNKESEEFNVNEIQSIKEFESFPAEDYKCKELYINRSETYKSKEIQSQSFVEKESSKKIINNKKSELDHKQLQSSMSSSTTATTSSAVSSSVSVGARIATTMTIGAVATGVVAIPIIAESKIDYGQLEFINYKVEINDFNEIEDQILLNKGVYIYFDEGLKDEYKAVIINISDDKQIELDKELDYVYFDNLTSDNYVFEVQIKDVNDEVIETYNVDVNTTCEVPFEFSDYDFLTTYNEDLSTNFYYYSFRELSENYEIKNEVKVKNSQDEEISFSYKEENGVICIEDINSDTYNIFVNTYLKDSNNYYMIGKSEVIDIVPYDFSWDASVDLNKLDLSIYGTIVDELKMTVEYYDSQQPNEMLFDEVFYLTQQDISQSINLSKISDLINITIEGNIQTSYESDFISNYKGNIYYKINSSKQISPTLYTSVNIERVEVLNTSYSNVGNTPINIYLDGYINGSDTIDINLYNSYDELIDSVENISEIDQKTTFEIMLNQDSAEAQIYKIEYVVKDSLGNVISQEIMEVDMTTPPEYLSANVYYTAQNPMDIYQTYNEDGTFNAYFYMDYVNESIYEAYYKIDLLMNDESIYSKLGNDNICAFEDLEANNYYLNYSLFIKQDKIYYSIKDVVYPSGEIGVINKDGYHLMGYTSLYAMESINDDGEVIPYKYDVYSAGCEIYGDLKVTLIFDGGTIEELTVLESEIVDNQSFSLDLTEYSYQEVTVRVECLANAYYGKKDIIEENYSTKGNAGCLCELETTIYNAQA